MKVRLLIAGSFTYAALMAAIPDGQSFAEPFEAATKPSAGRNDDKQAENDIRRLYDVERENLLHMDIAAQERFLPEDFVVTNPFNMFIDKKTVVERLRTNIIKYRKYERQFDDFRRYGDTMVVIGSETVVPTPDANRPDAGKTVKRRFTEMWVRRDGTWQKVVRHASNVTQP